MKRNLPNRVFYPGAGFFGLAMGIGLLWSLSVRAQQPDPNTIKQTVGELPPEAAHRLGGDLNFGMIDGDLFTTVNVGLNLDFGKIGFGVQAPLRIRIMDNDDSGNAVGIREEDWDEFSDYLKILRFFRYGHKGEIIYVMVGNFPGQSIGHGTIVDRYYNNLDLDHYKMGIAFDFNTDYGGLETLINHVAWPTVFGARGYIRPWSFVDTESYLNNLAVGFTTVSDIKAPYVLDPGKVEDGYPVVIEEKAATLIGGDIEFRVLNIELLTMTPYIDLNHIIDGGTGLHVGLLNVFHLPVITLDLTLRLEYRYFAADYIPAYFNSFYEIQKFSYPFKDETLHREIMAPKRFVVESLGDKGLNGYYAELIFNFMGLFTLGASYDDYDGPFNSNLRLYLDVPALEVFQFGAYYYKHNFEGADEAFTFDEKSLFLVEARYQITSFLYLIGQYWKIWQLNQTTGEYDSVNDWSLGVGFSYTF